MDIVRIVNQHQEHLITYRREELIILKLAWRYGSMRFYLSILVMSNI